ncbi:metallophosphatase [Staphylococcus phage vB_StaM_PB50]|nr:metallophosphatase [Staphylococcus phage vB_StaM_PB50]
MENNIFKTVAIADLHYGKKNPKKLTDELNEYFVKYIEDNNDIDMVVISGDLFDRVIRFNEPSGKEVLEFMDRMFTLSEEKNFLLRLLKGTKTHDFNQLDVFNQNELEYNNFKIINTLESELVKHNGKEVNLLYIPEEYPDDKKEFYNELLYSVEDNTYDNIFGHGMIDFVTFVPDEDDSENPVKSAPILESKELMRVTKGVTVYGHIHDFHEYKDKVYYCGSYSRYSFKDTEDKGFLVIENNLDEDDYNVELILNEKAPTYVTINMDQYENLTEQKKLEIINELRQENDYVRFVSTSKDDVDIIKQISSSDKNIKVQFNNKNIKEVKVDEKYQFILDDELDVPETIIKFNSIKHDKDLDLKEVKNIIDPDFEDLINLDKEK